MDLDPWSVLARDPREYSAFTAWSAAMVAAGHVVVPRGSPDNQRALYEELFSVPAGILTVDAHVRFNGLDWFIDHTILPLPRSEDLPAVVRTATQRLRASLTGTLLRCPTASLVISVNVRHLVMGRAGSKERKNSTKVYLDRLASLARHAAETGVPVYDLEDPDHLLPGALPAAQPLPAARPEDPIMFLFENRVRSGARFTDLGWVQDTAWLQANIGDAIRGKLRKQLARARAFGKTGLLIDARMGWEASHPSPR
jgi:hypothetical protein